MQLHKSTTEKYLAKNINQEFGGQLTIGQRVADKVASLGGSWPFILIFLFALFLWILSLPSGKTF